MAGEWDTILYFNERQIALLESQSSNWPWLSFRLTSILCSADTFDKLAKSTTAIDEDDWSNPYYPDGPAIADLEVADWKIHTERHKIKKVGVPHYRPESGEVDVRPID